MTRNRRLQVPASRMGLALAALVLASQVQGQTLSYDSHKKLAVPKDANIRFSDMWFAKVGFTESVGYRYVKTTGTGATNLFNEEYGNIRKDGSDFPIDSSVRINNYVLLSPEATLDLSIQLRYLYFPSRTQDNAFEFGLADQGVASVFGGFTFRLMDDGWYGGYAGDKHSLYASEQGQGMNAMFDAEMEFTPYVRGRIYESPSYRVDYVDARGDTDLESGQRFEVFQNLAGANLYWLTAKDKDFALTLSRTDTIPVDEEAFNDQRSVVHVGSLLYEQTLTRDWLIGLLNSITFRSYPGAERGDQMQHDHQGFTRKKLTDFSTGELALGYAGAQLTDPGPLETEGSSGGTIGRVGLRTDLRRNLWHSLTYSRALTSGYSSGLELDDDVRYSLVWSGEPIAVGTSVARHNAEPKLSTATAYRDWLMTVFASWPMMKEVTLHVSTAYTIRDNDPPAPAGTTEEDGTGDENDDEATLINDYDTWTSAFGITYRMTKRSTLAAYINHTTRLSDEPSLEFARDILGTTFTYDYSF